MRRKAEHQVHYALRNWGAVQRSAMTQANIPLQYPKGASWQDQITGGESWLDLDAPEEPNEQDAKITQKAMVRCMAADMEAAMILTKRYRDGWSVEGKVLNRARAKFWRYL